MTETVVIVAGGSGSRMNTTIPKQFLEIHGLPVLMHTIQKFYSYNPKIDIRLVLPKEQFELWKELCIRFNFKVSCQLFAGGQTRFHSVKNGLYNLPNNTLVAIHDGVRPLVSTDTIAKCFKAAAKYGAAIPVTSVDESIRRVEASQSVAEDRIMFKLVQTPQVFNAEVLLKAYDALYHESFTDDASVVEYSGEKIHLVEGNKENIKITNPNDLAIAETLLKVI